MTVTGSGFGVSRGNSRVSFADVHVTDIVSWSDTEIKATVPVGAKTGPVVVTRGAVASTGKPFTLTAMKSLRGECSCTYSILDSPLHITTSAVWSVAGEGLVITVSDSTGVCILADARTSGKITIAPDASLIGDTTYETMYGGRRYVYRYKSPQLQPPIKGENYSHSDGITVTPGGGGSELTFEYALHPTHYAGDISIKVWYRVPYDVEVYEKNGDLVSSETDKLGQLYNACYVFIQANDD